MEFFTQLLREYESFFSYKFYTIYTGLQLYGVLHVLRLLFIVTGIKITSLTDIIQKIKTDPSSKKTYYITIIYSFFALGIIIPAFLYSVTNLFNPYQIRIQTTWQLAVFAAKNSFLIIYWVRVLIHGHAYVKQTWSHFHITTQHQHQQ